MDEYVLFAAMAGSIGVPHEWRAPESISATADRWSALMILTDAIIHLTEGYINPVDVMMARARGAPQRGGATERRWQVDGRARAGEHWT